MAERVLHYTLLSVFYLTVSVVCERASMRFGLLQGRPSSQRIHGFTGALSITLSCCRVVGGGV